MRHREQPIASDHCLFDHPLRLVAFPLGETQMVPADVRARYSEMKYGGVDAQNWWVEVLLQLILSDGRLSALINQFGRLYLASSAYGAVPTAAANLTEVLAKRLAEEGYDVQLFKIERHGGFERTNYGMLGSSARRRIMRARKLALTRELSEELIGKCVLVIDDIRCTGAHERETIALFGNETTPGALAFAYCIGLEGDAKPSVEEDLNHEKIRRPADLLPWFTSTLDGPRMNARLLKFILLQNASSLTGYLAHIGPSHALRLYDAALSADGYFDKSRFRQGFAALEEWLLGEGYIPRRRSFGVRNEAEGKVVAWNVVMGKSERFFCAETGVDLSNEVSLYSRFKFGDVEAITLLARTLAHRMILTLEHGGSLRSTFERAKQHGEFVSLTAPGIRNVVSASNQLMREVGMLVNVWLTIHSLPTMVIRSFGRLSSGRANYAELNANQRASREKTTQTLMPMGEYQAFPSHVIFIDDIEVTGQTANRAREASLDAGALGFHSAFIFRVDPEQARQKAGVEHQMNHHFVNRKLDGNSGFLLGNLEYQPVQRMLRLLLHPENQDVLLSFLEKFVPDKVLIRIYLSAMANDYLWIHGQAREELGEYGPSLVMMRSYMENRGLLDSKGLPI